MLSSLSDPVNNLIVNFTVRLSFTVFYLPKYLKMQFQCS